ncbi:MAG: 2-oxoglutarate oxidoreductase, partial [Ruminiclostridium sp.]|nr:2-oxoglutarate oxidoreductase [Ruminiclostridium sp.]
GVKRARPDALLIARPGDGSAYSIGIESTISCAMRNENILTIVINNSVFGMTGGQMSPATLYGMKTSTSPFGRTAERNGSMMDITKLLGQTDIAYLARCSVDSIANINKTQKCIEKALKKQMNGEGFCLVEVLSPCPTNWKLTPEQSMEFIRDTQSKALPLGEFIDKGGKEA